MTSDGWSWFQELFLGTPRDRELKEMAELCARVKRARLKSPFADEESLGNFLVDLIHEICDRRGVAPSVPLGEMLWQAIKRLLYADGILVEIPEESALEKLTMEEGVLVRATLNRQLRFLADQDRLLTIWRGKLLYAFSGMLEYFPLSAFTDIDERGIAADDSVVLPEAKAYDLCDNLPEVIERTLKTFYDDDISNAHLFDPVRARFEDNLCLASGISLDGRNESKAKIVTPCNNRNKSPEFLIQTYLQGTPFFEFFHGPLPFAIPFPARFEHTHVVGGTGHGKTQLLQFLINHDLVRAKEDKRSVVVIDSQGDLIRTVSQLGHFNPHVEDNLSDRFVLIDPNDVENPVCLNMFDFNRERLSRYSPLDREKILNATVELYEYFFGALLGAELTQRQGVIFKYLARLLLEIPDATIHTLRELMEDGEPFRPYMEKLTGSTRSFFATRFFDRQFAETKKQILARLWGILANSSLERMFSHKRSKVDIFEMINEGKIILINTAKDLLGQDGAAIFGRFFIALISQATVQRAAQLPHERRSTFVYIDEAQDYFDDNISSLLNQARKYRVGLVFAHQNLDQLESRLRASVLSSTSIKFAGGLSAKDAGILDSELRCDGNFLLGQRKGKAFTEFACHVRNFTDKALSVRVPLGYVESLPVLDEYDQTLLLQENRRRYSGPPELPAHLPFPTGTVSTKTRARPPTAETAVVDLAPEPRPPSAVHLPEPSATPITPQRCEPSKAAGPRPPVEPAQAGRGGQQHKYLQHLLKQLGEQRGFRASIEESILAGEGRVDVSLVRDETRIAFEISVTTGHGQELANVEKCIAAGYPIVVLVGATQRHVKELSRFIEENLADEEKGRVRYLAPDGLVEYLDSFGWPEGKEQTVRGYKVRTKQVILTPEDADARRKALGAVIARSLSQRKKNE